MTITTENDWMVRAEQRQPDKFAEVIAAMRRRSQDGPTDYLSHAGGNEQFAAWLYLADMKMMRAVGVGIFDIGDWMMADAFEAGDSPYAAALEALRNDDTYSALCGSE